MDTSARRESAAGEGDGPEGAEMVASLIYDGFEYFDGDDITVGRHLVDGGTGIGLTDRVM